MSQADRTILVITAEAQPQEWQRMWAQLADLNDGDPVCQCPRTGQTWQYLCTAHTEDGWMHHFRHRHHPATGHRTSILIPCSDEFLQKEWNHAQGQTAEEDQAARQDPVDAGRG